MNYTDSNELPDSPSHNDNSKKEKIDYIRKEIDFTKEKPVPTKFKFPPHEDKTSKSNKFPLETEENKKNEDNNLNSDLENSLDKEMNELVDINLVKNIEKRLKERESTQNKKLSDVKGFKDLNLKDEQKNLEIIETFGSNLNLSDRNLADFLKNDGSDKKIEDNELINLFKDKKSSIDGFFNKKANLDTIENIEKIEKNDRKKQEKHVNLGDFDMNKQGSLSPFSKIEEGCYVVSRTKVEKGWLMKKSEEEYFLYLVNSFVLAETHIQLIKVFLYYLHNFLIYYE